MVFHCVLVHLQPAQLYLQRMLPMVVNQILQQRKGTVVHLHAEVQQSFPFLLVHQPSLDYIQWI